MKNMACQAQKHNDLGPDSLNIILVGGNENMFLVFGITNSHMARWSKTCLSNAKKCCSHASRKSNYMKGAQAVQGHGIHIQDMSAITSYTRK